MEYVTGQGPDDYESTGRAYTGQHLFAKVSFAGPLALPYET